MNILLISDSYPPEVRSASRLMHEFATGLAQYGHDVTVLTTFPKYNLAEGSSKDFRRVEKEDGIQVIRIHTLDIHLVGILRRGIGVLSLPFYFVQTGRKHVRNNIDIILVYSPPLTLVVAGSLLARHFKAKFVLNVQDLFPQNAIDLGMMKNRFLIAFFEMIEQYAYRSADFISVHSQGNLNTLLGKKRVEPKKIGVFHNWVEVNNKAGGESRDVDFRKEYGLSEKFVILFGGVMGPAQGLDVVLSAAEYLKNSKACFLVVGDGTEKSNLQKRALREELGNIVFKPFVELDKYEAVLECADAGLVTLSKEMKTPVVPGKLVSYMAKKIPVLASLNRESDGRQIVRDAGCGSLSDAGDGEQLARNVIRLMDSPDRAREMGESGWEYVIAHMSKEKILNQYIALFERLLSNEDHSSGLSR